MIADWKSDLNRILVIFDVRSVLLRLVAADPSFVSCLKDPQSSPLLSTTKECHFSQFSAEVHLDKPGSEESRRIMPEDVNVEHLLDIFTSTDVDSKNPWDACGRFMVHLSWHKPRFVVLGPKIEALSDDHPSKAADACETSWFFHSVGNWVEYRRLLTYALKLWRGQGDDHQVAETL